VGHDLNELGILLLDPAEQLDLILRHELEPVEVIAKLIELAKRCFERPLIWRQESRGNAVELAGGVMLELAVSRNLAVERYQLLGAVVRLAQHVKANGANHDEQHHHHQESRQELGVNSGW
jgi:hypothetical protein